MFKPYHQNDNDNSQKVDSDEVEGMFDIIDAAGEHKVEASSVDAQSQAAGADAGQEPLDQVDFDGALSHADIKPLDVSAPAPAGVESVDFSAVLKPVTVAQAVANTTTPVAGNSAAAAQPAAVAAAAFAEPAAAGTPQQAEPAMPAAHADSATVAPQPIVANQPVAHTEDFAFPAPVKSPESAPPQMEATAPADTLPQPEAQKPQAEAAAAGGVAAAVNVAHDDSVEFDQTEKPVAVVSASAANTPIEFDQTEKDAHEVVPEIATSSPAHAEAPDVPAAKAATESVDFKAAEKPIVPEAPAVPAVAAPAAATASAPVAETLPEPVATKPVTETVPPAVPAAAAAPAVAAPAPAAVAATPTAPVSKAAPAAVAPAGETPAAAVTAMASASAPAHVAAAAPVTANAADSRKADTPKRGKGKSAGKGKKSDDEEFGRSGVLNSVRHGTAWTVFFTILSLLWIYPIVLVLFNSFKKKQYISGSATFQLPDAENWTGIDNYTRGVQQTNLIASFGWTVFITVGAVALILVCTSMCAWWIVRVNNLFARIIYMLFLFNMIVPFQMVMYPLSKLANMMGLDTPWGLWIIYLGFGAGLSVFMFTGVIKGLPSSIEESAMIDGASVPQTFFGIVWPMMKPSMVSVAILQTMWIWNDYLLPYLILDMKKYKTMSIAVQYLKGGFGSIDMGAMMGCLVLAMLPIIIFYLVCQKYIIAGVTAGAVKG